MGSRSGSRLFGSSAKSRTRRPPPPAPSRRAAPAPAQQSGGMFGGGGLGSMLMQGMAWGAASSVGHRAVDAIAGPRTMQVEHTGAAAPAQAAPGTYSESKQAAQGAPAGFNCRNEMQDFNKCVTDNSGDIGKCQFYYDMMQQCSRQAKEEKQWS